MSTHRAAVATAIAALLFLAPDRAVSAQGAAGPLLHVARRGDALVVHYVGSLSGVRGLLLERQVGEAWRTIGDTVTAPASLQELEERLGARMPDVTRLFDAESEPLLWLRLQTDALSAGLAALLDPALGPALGRRLVDPRVGTAPARYRVRLLGSPDRTIDVVMPRAAERLVAAAAPSVSHVPTALTVRWRAPSASDALAWHVEGRSSSDTAWRRLNVRPIVRSGSSDTLAAVIPLAREGVVWQIAVRPVGAGGFAGPLSKMTRYEAFDRTPPRPVLDPRATLDTLDAAELRWSAAPEPDAAGYIVYRSTDGRERGQRLTAVPLPVEQLAWRDTARLEPGAYIYRLSVVDSSRNESVPGNAAPINVPDRVAPPLAGSITVVVLGDSAVRLRWPRSAARDLREYIVSRQRGDRPAGDSWARLTRTLARDTVLVDRGTDGAGLRGARLLRYRVIAVDSTGNASEPLEAEVVIPDLLPPTAPEWIRAERVPGRVVVTWAASASADVAQYELRRSAGTGDSLIATLTAGERAAWDDFEAGAGARRYSIVARDSAGNASTSRSGTAPVDAGPLLRAPSNVIATVRANGVGLRWDPVSGAVRYRVERATSRNGDYVVVGTVTSAAHVDPSAPPGAWYRVRAVDAGDRAGLASVATEATPR